MPSAEDWDDLLLPEIDRQQAARKPWRSALTPRFANPEIYDALEQRGRQTMRSVMPANKYLGARNR